MRTWWKKPKCKLCKKKVRSENSLKTVEMDTSEGPYEIKVCDECAKFFDAMIDALERQYAPEALEDKDYE